MMLSPFSVLITGANRGIGFEMVKQFLRFATPPKFIFAGCRNPQRAEELSKIAGLNANVTILKLDMLDDESIVNAKATVESTLAGKGLTLLINNAGSLGDRLELDDITRAEMVSLFETNAVGPLMMTKAFLPLLKKSAQEKSDIPMSCNRSAVMNISSDLGSMGLNVVLCGYGYRASKAALNMITSNLGTQLKEDGVLCLAIHPGWVQTDMGGPNGHLTPETSVIGLFKTVAKFEGPSCSGQFYNGQTGETMPW